MNENNENQFELIKNYDRLEALCSGEASADQAPDLAGELEVVQLLMDDNLAEVMPRPVEFQHMLVRRIRQRPGKKWWHGGVALLAAAVAVFFLVPRSVSNEIQVDGQALDLMQDQQTQLAMISYLDETEKLLTAIRDYEITCTANQTDLSMEKALAGNLLMRQKQLNMDLNKPRYYRARQLLSQIENILVDLNSLDPCTDPLEVDFLNEHINENRILSKVRIIAQDIQLS